MDQQLNNAQVPQHIEEAIRAGDARQQPMIDENATKVKSLEGAGGLLTPTGIVAVIGALAAAYATVGPAIIKPLSTNPDAVQKVQVVNWPNGTTPGLTDDQKKALKDLLK